MEALVFGLGKIPNLQVFRFGLYLDTYGTMEQNKYPTHSYNINNYTLFERVSFKGSNFKFIFYRLLV